MSTIARAGCGVYVSRYMNGIQIGILFAFVEGGGDLLKSESHFSAEVVLANGGAQKRKMIGAVPFRLNVVRSETGPRCGFIERNLFRILQQSCPGVILFISNFDEAPGTLVPRPA